MMTLETLYQEGVNRLVQAGVGDAALDARTLLLENFDLSLSAWLTRRGLPLPDGEEDRVARYRELIDRRAGRIPLQQITGTQGFMGLEFAVNEHVLIPRQDTETLVELVLAEETDLDLTILDLCTGSGCIAISLASLGGYRRIIGADLSKEALKVAEQNGKRLLKDSATELSWILSDMFQAFPEPEHFDCIVSNPPYIPAGVIAGLEPEVRDHEPIGALDGGEDGLVFYRILAEQGRERLKPGGRIYMEIGWDQGETVPEIFRNMGFEDIQVIQDMTGKNRVVKARKKQKQ